MKALRIVRYGLEAFGLFWIAAFVWWLVDELRHPQQRSTWDEHAERSRWSA